VAAHPPAKEIANALFAAFVACRILHLLPLLRRMAVIAPLA
jgi:hypothetical protein